MSLRSAIGKLADLIWPRVCAVEACRRASDRAGRHICSRCLAALPFHEAGGACRICGAHITAEARHDFVCEACQATPPAYAFARSALRYEGEAEALVKAFKFRRATWLCEDLADFLEGAVRAKLDAPAVDVVVPVPLHPNRERARGHNQSALLAQSLARRLGRRSDGHSLVRIVDTEQQSRLSGETRLANVRDAFAVRAPQWIRGRTVLLVDDVMTTGATLSHCARALRDAGAARVWCATVARAVMRN